MPVLIRRTRPEAGDVQAPPKSMPQCCRKKPRHCGSARGPCALLPETGDLPRAEQTIGLVPLTSSTFCRRRQRSRRPLDPARSAEKAGDVAQLEAQVQARPADHQAPLIWRRRSPPRAKPEALDQLLGGAPPRPQVERGGAARKPSCSCSTPGGQRRARHARGPAQAVIHHVLLRLAAGPSFVEDLGALSRAAVTCRSASPCFRSPGAQFCCRAPRLPLNIFESRYLQMLEDVMAPRRVLGMVQPRGDDEEPVARTAPLRRVAMRAAGDRLPGARRRPPCSSRVWHRPVSCWRDEVPLAKSYRICT